MRRAVIFTGDGLSHVSVDIALSSEHVSASPASHTRDPAARDARAQYFHIA